MTPYIYTGTFIALLNSTDIKKRLKVSLLSMIQTVEEKNICRRYLNSAVKLVVAVVEYAYLHHYLYPIVLSVYVV